MIFGGFGGALLPKATGWFLDQNGVVATRWWFACTVVVMLARDSVCDRRGEAVGRARVERERT